MGGYRGEGGAPEALAHIHPMYTLAKGHGAVRGTEEMLNIRLVIVQSFKNLEPKQAGVFQTILKPPNPKAPEP